MYSVTLSSRFELTLTKYLFQAIPRRDLGDEEGK